METYIGHDGREHEDNEARAEHEARRMERESREITITLTVPEALYALTALGRQVTLGRAMDSGDEWLDRTAVGLYESAQRKLERAIYPDMAMRARTAPMAGWDPAEQ